jgi:dGTP triphosphohydrolase
MNAEEIANRITTEYDKYAKYNKRNIDWAMLAAYKIEAAYSGNNKFIKPEKISQLRQLFGDDIQKSDFESKATEWIRSDNSKVIADLIEENEKLKKSASVTDNSWRELVEENERLKEQLHLCADYIYDRSDAEAIRIYQSLTF